MLLKVAREHSFHPIRDQLDGLKWDGRERLDSVLPVYFGTDDSPYTRAVGRMMLISMMARVYEPGCKVVM